MTREQVQSRVFAVLDAAFGEDHNDIGGALAATLLALGSIMGAVGGADKVSELFEAVAKFQADPNLDQREAA